MRLVSEWKLVLQKAWSLRLMLAAGLLSGFEVALPLLPIQIDPGWFAALSMIFTAAAFVARLVVQQRLADAVKQNQTDKPG